MPLIGFLCAGFSSRIFANHNANHHTKADKFAQYFTTFLMFASAIKIAKNPLDKSDVLIGARVFHAKFGYGTIEGTDGDRLTINFEKTGIKTILKQFVNFA